MSYLEAEIDESLENLGIQSRKLAPENLDILITSLGNVFFCEVPTLLIQFNYGLTARSTSLISGKRYQNTLKVIS